ncbi:MAG TPA: zinc-ribbon domain-containing protein, partial [Anaerolineales bacterium]|nr:zinc-ribbon domain-containing protein [Anaerolineales bacterium]
MNCPKCSQPIPDHARYCPSCGTGVDVAARVDVRIDVEHNQGRVVGVQTDAIHGDVYGNSVYQVQVYVLSESSRAQPQGSPPALPSGPYKFLSPYTPLDRAIFKGRQVEIEQAVRRLGEGRLLVLYGPTGVGKTSLLAAGVIPELIGAGALAVHIRDYSRPLGEALRAALQGSQAQLALSLPDGDDLPGLLTILHSQLNGTLVLVLDQFESLFHSQMDPQLYAQIINELVSSLRQLEPEYLRLILSIEDNALVRLSDLQQALPDVFRSFMQLDPLGPDQARAAILEPLEVFKPPPVYLSAGLVDSLIIPDLIELSPDMPAEVYPPHLQIVCHRLFELAVKLSPPEIDQNLYVNQSGGAEGILAGFLDETLRLGLGSGVEECNRCLIALATAGDLAWVAAEELAIDGLDKNQIQAGLERLEQAGLLVSRLNQQRVEFAFTSPIVAQAVRRMAGPEIENLGQARADLERGWSGWLAHGDIIPPRPLRRISAVAQQLMPNPLQGLLLIRSALSDGSSPAVWLPGLATGEGLALVTALEGVDSNPDPHPSVTRLAQAKSILGIDPDQPEVAGDGGFGLLAKTAVGSRDPAVRGAAILALQAPDAHQALSRLDWALAALSGSWQRFWRKSELRGLLEDEVQIFYSLDRKLPLPQRSGIWLWRFLRSLRRERTTILWSALGAALGAGVGLGLWRGLVAWLAGSTVPGFLGFVHVIYGILLGGSLSLGINLGRMIRLDRITPLKKAPDNRKIDWLPVLLGGIGFGLAHAWIFTLNGGSLLSNSSLVLGSGFLAGLLLSALLVKP